MPRYRLAGQEIDFSCPVPELRPFEIDITLPLSGKPFVPPSFLENSSDTPSPLRLTNQTVGWVGEEYRRVETWTTASGYLLKVAGGNDVYIAARGEHITSLANDPSTLTSLDREILVGPALVLALALCDVWSLHASAILLDGRALLILGESGQGKSTLAAHLGRTFPRAADDILPVTIEETSPTIWPHFPQLKLPMDSQPGTALPESIPAGWICLLAETDPASAPALERLSPSQATQTLLRHTAGTRLFGPDLLTSHLNFCARAAKQTPAYQLTYPHRREALPQVQELLKTLC